MTAFEDELSGEFGRIDQAALRRIRDCFTESEPLVDDDGFDDPGSPRVLRIETAQGLGAPGRFDVRWSVRDNYSIHYEEPDLSFRFDCHPNPHSPRRHVHLPPDAGTTEPSCITVAEPELVALAVVQRWRAVLEADDPGVLNEGADPP